MAQDPPSQRSPDGPAGSPSTQRSINAERTHSGSNPALIQNSCNGIGNDPDPTQTEFLYNHSLPKIARSSANPLIILPFIPHL